MLLKKPNLKSSLILQLLITLQLILLVFTGNAAAQTPPILNKFIKQVPASELVKGADGYGKMLNNISAVPVLKANKIIGYAFITSDFVGTTGYSGKPIHVMVAIGTDAKLLGANLVKHSEPIVLIGIPNSKIKAMTESYRGLDIVAEASRDGSAHDFDIISGATVTIMIIDDSIVRSSIKVARALGLAGLKSETAKKGPTHKLNLQERTIRNWDAMAGDGTTRRMTLDISQINKAFAATGDKRVLKHKEAGAPDDTFIDMHTALVSAPSIGLSLMGKNEYANLVKWIKKGEHAILIMGRGVFSFKGNGYVRGGIFDRIQLIQGDISVRFRDRGHRRLGSLATAGAPSFTEIDLFKIPADSGFDQLSHGACNY